MAGIRTRKRIIYADDDRLSISRLLILRIPPLIIGLLLGTGLSVLTSNFEVVLAKQVQLAFFLPFLVYISGAVGTQTQTIYTRDLSTGHATFSSYLFKESILGMIIGTIIGLMTYGITIMWLRDAGIATAIGLSMFLSTAIAPPLAVLVTEVFSLHHDDPAVFAGPVATVIQDAVSIVIFGLVTSAIVL